jgi:hypothetical protein
MQPRLVLFLVNLFLLGAAILSLQPLAAAGGAAASGTQEAGVIRCRALETHASSKRAVTIVLFHQEAKEEQKPLSDLLRRYSGANVEWQGSDGKWEPATVIRLKSCFGRGLLVIPAGTGAPKDGESFLLKFPEAEAGAAK